MYNKITSNAIQNNKAVLEICEEGAQNGITSVGKK